MASLVDTTKLAQYEAGDPQTLLDIASGVVQRYVGWHIAPVKEDDVLTVDGRGGVHLWLPTMHMTDVASITNEGEALDTEDYDWSADGFVELRCGHWTKRPRGIVATITHGYETTPEDITGVIVASVARVKASPTGAYLQRAGAVQMQWQATTASAIAAGMLETEKAVLDLYKLPPRQ